jgi:hypothetical protein
MNTQVLAAIYGDLVESEVDRTWPGKRASGLAHGLDQVGPEISEAIPQPAAGEEEHDRASHFHNLNRCSETK